MATESTPMWSTIAAERAALADDLAQLTDEQWETPSLCEGWTVRDVLAHMASTAAMTPVRFFGSLARHGFRFEKMARHDIETYRGASPAETLKRFRSLVDATTAPPGPALSWLGETIVHAEDIRRPLGIEHTYPSKAVREVAEFYQGSNLILGTKRRIAGLHLAATDDPYAFGEVGRPLVAGPMLAMLLAMTGRRAGLADLQGDGVAVLGARP